jgi:hypothetical protein
MQEEKIRENFDIYMFLAKKVLSLKKRDFVDVVDMLVEIAVSDLFNYGYYSDSNIQSAIYYMIYRWLSNIVWGKKYNPGEVPLFICKRDIDAKYLASRMALRVHFTIMELIRQDREVKKDGRVRAAKDAIQKQSKLSKDVYEESRNALCVDRSAQILYEV